MTDPKSNQTTRAGFVLAGTDREATYIGMRKMGRCANGNEADGGRLYHAVNRESGKALCGNNPERRSAGWSSYTSETVTCPMCVKKLTKAIAPRTSACSMTPP